MEKEPKLKRLDLEMNIEDFPKDEFPEDKIIGKLKLESKK